MITVHMKDYRTFSGFRFGMHGGFVWLLFQTDGDEVQPNFFKPEEIEKITFD